MKHLFDYIASRRFAIQILLVTTSIILISNLLPKTYIMTDSEVAALRKERPLIYNLSTRFNVAEVTKSPYFIAVTVFLFASIMVCTIKRTKTALEGMEKEAGIPDIRSLTVRHSIDIKEGLDAEGAAEAVMAGKRWKSAGSGADGVRVLYSRKGSEGLWGSVAFHAGMCVILIGVFVSSQTRYNGNLLLIQDFDIDPSRVLMGLSKNERHVFPIRKTALASFEPVYREGFPLDYTANILNLDLEGQEFAVAARVNEPFMAGGYQFLLSRYGFAPRFVLKDTSGKVVSDDVVSLVVFNPDQEDTFPLLKGKAVAKVRFFPDFYIDTSKGAPSTRSRIPKRPVFLVSIESKGRNVGGGFLKQGEPLDWAGYTIEFKELRYWVQLGVSKDSGVPVITVGFFAIVIGLALRLLLNEKALWIIINQGNIGIGGRARFFPALFEEELKMLAEEIRAKSEVRSRESGG